MQTVVETNAFRRAAVAAGMTDDERQSVTNVLASNPGLGDLLEGTGGARKFRFGARGKGKSGGYRIITYYAAADVPVFLLDLYVKGEKVNLTKAERNEMKTILATLADDWRASAKAKIAELGQNTRVSA